MRGLLSEARARGEHWRWSAVNGVDDLADVDALEIDAGDAEVRVAELALDDQERDALTGHLDSVSMPQLMVVPTSAQPSLSRLARYADLGDKYLLRGIDRPELSA